MRAQSWRLDDLALAINPHGPYTGLEVLEAILALAEQATASLLQESNCIPTAVLGRLRGNRRDLHFSDLIAKLETDHPISLESPFEGSDRVSGAVWVRSQLASSHQPGPHESSLAKLRWEDHAIDLPMHVHEHSDRCIIVHEGRGYFHVTDESVDNFTGTRVRTVPARERDVFLFTRGVVHTFSTAAHAMTLLSCQVPYLPFDHPKQFRLPKFRWIAKEHPDTYAARIGCDDSWQHLASTVADPNPIRLHHLLA